MLSKAVAGHARYVLAGLDSTLTCPVQRFLVRGAKR